MTLFRPTDLAQHAVDVVRERKVKRYFADETLVPHTKDIKRGIRHYLYTSVKAAGVAAMHAWGASLSGLATSRVAVDERFVPIQPVTGVWSVAEDEVLGGAIVEVDSVKTRISVEVGSVLDKIDDVGYSGEASFGIYGITNQPGANVISLPATGSGPIPTALANKTSTQIVQTLNFMLNATAKATDGAYTSPHILLPTTAFMAAAETLDANNNNESALTIFLKNARQLYPNVEVRHLPFLSNAGPTGESVAVVYHRSPEYIEYVRVPGVFVSKTYEYVGSYTGKITAYLGGIALKDATPFSMAFNI